ncbi:MAG: M24 family metallopeptidase [Xanthomonadales bacterium]|nr:M24 family metallopeptidase [Xanthomonadales bacterium]
MPPSYRFGLLAMLLAGTCLAAEPEQGEVLEAPGAVLSWRQRPAVENRIMTERLEQLLPQLMEETGIDMWLVINREYAEDPVYFSLVPQPSFAARRTTMLLFARTPEGFERLSVNRYPLGAPYETAWSGGDLDAQWAALADLITQRNPQRIAINSSRDWPVADGLTQGLYQRLVAALPTGYEERLVSAEALVVRWVETRTEREAELYRHVVGLARSVIAEAFSNAVITPGATHTDDVAWFIRERFAELQLPVWFQPYVNRQAADLPCTEDQDFCGAAGIIRRGDVLHTDVGICYLKLCTDTQEMAYVLRNEETAPPPGLRKALALGNQWQDDLTDAFVSGRSGNEILAKSLATSRKRGLIASTYTHPIGFFGHAPGPTIGMWDNQGDTPVRGDWPLAPMTAYAIEGNIRTRLSEWDDNWVQIKLEQTALFNGQSVRYSAGRQTQWHLVR